MITNEMMLPLLKEKKRAAKELAGINKAISGLQNICTHEFVEQGHDSHKTHYKCKHCSWEEAW